MAPIDPISQAYLLQDAAQTEAVGAQIAQWLLAGQTDARLLEHFKIYLQGELGAGKTTVARALLRTLGVQGTIKSPTFTRVETYSSQAFKEIAHFDFYRLNDPQEWVDAGFAEIFVNAKLIVAEWPEMAQDVLPPADLLLNLLIAADGGHRGIRFEAGSPQGLNLAEHLANFLLPSGLMNDAP